MKIYPTKTGENTLYLPDMDETYHSRDGVLSEALHVFIAQGFELVKNKREIQILEIGFGTGLNALVTAVEAARAEKIVKYTTLEAYPVPTTLALELKYGSLLNNDELFKQIQLGDWEKEVIITPQFTIKKLHQKIQDAELEKDSFDVIYFDAFAPKKQPEMWDKSIFEKLYSSLRKEGVLTTYSAAGQLKRDLKSVGFAIQNPPGANGKREMTVAIKI